MLQKNQTEKNVLKKSQKNAKKDALVPDFKQHSPHSGKGINWNFADGIG